MSSVSILLACKVEVASGLRASRLKHKRLVFSSVERVLADVSQSSRVKVVDDLADVDRFILLPLLCKMVSLIPFGKRGFGRAVPLVLMDVLVGNEPLLVILS